MTAAGPHAAPGPAHAAQAAGERPAEEAAVASLVVRERHSRDRARWAAMAEAYHDDSWVHLSWFDGTGADFVQASRERWSPGLQHRLSPPAVRVAGSRAVAETPAVVESRTEIDNVAVDLDVAIGCLTLLRRDNGVWRISRVDTICVHDRVRQVDPTTSLVLDRRRLATYRPSYQYLSYQMADRGLRPPMELPGDDRPELCAPLYGRAAMWLSDPAELPHAGRPATPARPEQRSQA